METPKNVDDEAWTMIAAWTSVLAPDKWERMAKGLCEMLDKQGFEIRKKK